MSIFFARWAPWASAQVGIAILAIGATAPACASSRMLRPEACAPKGTGISCARWSGPDGGLHAAPGCLRWLWSGSALEVHFVGDRLEADFAQLPLDAVAAGDAEQITAQSRYAVYVDGRPQQDVILTAAAAPTQTLAQNLPPGAHVAKLSRRTEGRFGPAVLCSLRAPGGRLLTPPRGQSLRRRLIVFGDSISAGYGVLCGAASERAGVFNEDAQATYGALAAAALHADFIGVARSGAGVWRNGDGGYEHTVPKLWAQDGATFAADGANVADTAIVINLGTNDFRGQDVDDAAFIADYVTFVRALHQQLPQAPILLALGPMLSDVTPAGANQLSHARRLIAHVADSALPHISLRRIEFAEQDGRAGFGCDYHPNAATHRQMAQDLIAALQTHLAW